VARASHVSINLYRRLWLTFNEWSGYAAAGEISRAMRFALLISATRRS
jgi:hypothetical protein